MSVAEMFADRMPARDIPIAGLPGLYAIFVAKREDLRAISLPDTGCLYIGRSIDLGQRNHFTARHSGFHSPRRSLGAILKDRLDLEAIPRAAGRSDTNFTNFRFSDAGEARLSEWMRACLDVAICDQVADLVQAERLAIRQAKPPLNLTLWQNGQKDLIQSLRAVCKAEAKTVWAKFNP